MVWGKAGSDTLTGTGDLMTITDLPANLSNFFISHTLASGQTEPLITFNNDTGSNYAYRYSGNGGADGTSTSVGYLINYWNGDVDSRFNVGHMINIPAEEKLYTGWLLENVTAGAGNAPERVENVGKWANTSNQFDNIGETNGGAGDYDTGSNITALGSDGTESLNVQDGAIYYETDTNKEFLLSNDIWTEL